MSVEFWFVFTQLLKKILAYILVPSIYIYSLEKSLQELFSFLNLVIFVIF